MIQTGQQRLAFFFHDNYSRLVNYVKGMIDDTAHRSSEDIVQDVMLSVLARPVVTAPVSNLSSYVFRSLRNRIIDLYRSPAADTVSLDRENEEGLTLFDILPDERFNPEDSFHSRALHRLVFDLIKELPSAQMEIIVETEFNGKTFRELSLLWRIPVGTLLARKHRGIRAVRNRLEQLQEVSND